MQNYLEKMLHQSVVVSAYLSSKRLPPYFSSNYHLETMCIASQRFLIATPKQGFNVVLLRKEHKQLEKMTGLLCVLLLSHLSAYSRDRLIEEGIPFIVPDKQLYLPFLGLALQEKGDRVLSPCPKISFLTQKLLLSALYEHWERVNVSEASVRLKVSKISITRVYDEIESLGLSYINKESRTRLFSAPKEKRKMWASIHPFLRNPLLQEFSFSTSFKLSAPYGGVSALAIYTLLNEDSYPTYAVTKDKIKGVIKGRLMSPRGEEVKTLVQEVGYWIPFPSAQALDPLSVALLFEDKEKDDPRIEKAVEEMLEEHVWSKD